MKVYKLTDENLKTFGGCQWKLGKQKRAPGTGPLCSKGWLHCYSSPLLAVLLSPIHVNFGSPRLFEAEAEGAMLNDKGLKLGVEKLTLAKEIELPKVTIEQRIKFALFCVLKATKNRAFQEWAENWLTGKDRTKAAAQKVAETADDMDYGWAEAEAAEAASRAAEEWAVESASLATKVSEVTEWAASKSVARAVVWAVELKKRPLNLIALAKKAVSP